jgi:putative ABC transport system permease protein
MIMLSRHLPPPLLLGARLMVRRPRRLLLTTFSVAVTTTALVIVLIWHATAAGFLGARVTQATTLVSVMLVILAAVNTVFIGWATALDARHPAALAQALGATPDQVTAGLSAGQLVPALAGALLGVGCGIYIYESQKNGAGTAIVVPVPWLAVLVAATLLAVAILTAVPARIGARRPVSDILQSESA